MTPFAIIASKILHVNFYERDEVKNVWCIVKQRLSRSRNEEGSAYSCCAEKQHCVCLLFVIESSDII